VTALVLHYDEFHTPLPLLGPVLRDAVVLDVDLGEAGHPPLLLPDGWRCRLVPARERFCESYLLRAIKANAVYGGGYTLSAALARPLLAEVCLEIVAEEEATSVVHGFAGNDQLRFELALDALAPGLEVTSVAALLGSQNRRKDDGYSVSENLWGRSVEAGPLADPGTRAPFEVVAAGDRCQDGCSEELHTVAFERGRPVGLDARELPLVELLDQLGGIGRAFGVGVVDMVEDGFVGLKTRAVYEAPAATALIVAHRELERLVSTRRQNDFKQFVDKAWTDLVYDGFWFDPQRESLEAYVEHVNDWVTGSADLLFRPGSVTTVARSAPGALYDADEAVYRFGQDFGVDATRALVEGLGAPSRAAIRRAESREPLGEAAWSE
jgi:argininosuccinate synthase